MATVNEKMTAIANTIRYILDEDDALTLDDMATDIPRVYNQGIYEGWHSGYTDGYDSGEEDGYTDGYDAGYYVGHSDGHDTGYNEGKTAGKAAENRAWWDCVTNNNTRTTYDGCFRGTNFNYITGGFNPPYTLKPTSAVRMFSKARGVTKIKKGQIDTSNNNSGNYMFVYCYDLEEIEEIEIGSDCMYMFSECYKLKTIGKLIIRNGITRLGENAPPFVNCTALENITIDGVIPYTLKFHSSPLLTAKSVESIVSALSDTASGQTMTFKTAVKQTYFNAHSSEYANADEAWDALCDTKPNWTISLT